MKALILILSLVAPAFAQAEETTCQINAIAMCACDAPYAVSCSNGKQGFATRDQKLTTVALNVFKDRTDKEPKMVTLANPPGSLGDFQGQRRVNPWTIEQLAAQGITLGDEAVVRIRNFTGEIVLFDEANGGKIKE